MKRLLKWITAALFLIPVAVLAAVVLINSTTVTVTTTPAVVNTQAMTFPLTVTVIPQSGVTATVLYSTTPDAYLNVGTANWSVLGTLSAVSTANTVTLPSPVTAIQFQRISGASAVIGELNWTK